MAEGENAPKMVHPGTPPKMREKGEFRIGT